MFWVWGYGGLGVWDLVLLCIACRGLYLVVDADLTRGDAFSGSRLGVLFWRDILAFGRLTIVSRLAAL